ncbi:hypothetical protein F4780DRAFT_787592 [Xylariomycetidae sp. FL0641]|nr:hypothetical protein F4780DRAFT_787592 [Xylariomycetidae sp. FL0641]
MCFKEFLGYTCGHTSIPINRPCPMVTQLHTNPCCPEPASRPFLAQSMCPSCARTLHGRWVDIFQYEHEWMHVRGVCGCETQFPALQQPRSITAHETTPSKPATTTPKPGRGKKTRRGRKNNNNTAGPGRQNGQEIPRPAIESSPQENFPGMGYGHHANEYLGALPEHTGAGTNVPLYEERPANNENLPVQVATRMSSLYAAEWTADHAKLHAAGACHCNVRFEAYTPSPDALRAAVEVDTSNTEDTLSLPSPHCRASTTPAAAVDAYPWYPQTTLITTPGIDAYLRHMAQPSIAHADADAYGTGTSPPTSGASTPRAAAAAPQAFATPRPGDPARWSCSPMDMSALPQAASHHTSSTTTTTTPRPVDRQSMRYGAQEDRGGAVPLAGSPLSDADDDDGNGQDHPLLLLPSTVQYPTPQAQTPLAAFPVGAGPEGDSHAGPFEACELNLQRHHHHHHRDHHHHQEEEESGAKEQARHHFRCLSL